MNRQRIYAANCSLRAVAVLAVLLAAMTVSSSRAVAQSNISISGIVTDSSNGLPVADAVVEVLGLQHTALTAADGTFALRGVPPGTVLLRVSRAGYRESSTVRLTVVEGFTRTAHVVLVATFVRMPDQTVEHHGQHTAPESAVRRYQRDDIIRDGHHTVSDALAAMPGLTVYGASEAPGGTRVSVGGEQPHRVKVLLDGLPLATGGNGSVDLNAIPLSAVAEIAVTPGAQASVSGDGAIGGVVDIRTDHSDSRIADVSMRGGEDERYGAEISCVIKAHPLVANVAIEHTHHGDQFRYPSGDSSAARVGTGLGSWRGFLGVSPAGQVPVRVSGFYYNSDAGLPGALEQATPNAENSSRRIRIQGTWASNARTHEQLGAGFWYESSSEHFVSPERLRADSELRERFVGARAYAVRSLDGFNVRAEIEGRVRRLEGVDNLRPHLSFGVHDRQEFSIRSRVDRFVNVGAHVLSASVSGSVDGDDVSSPFLAPRVDLGWSTPVGVHLRAGWGESFRRPLLTSLFWKADAYAVGNPDLLPEEAEEWDVGIGIQRGMISVDSRYFERDVQHIIVWQRSTVSGQYKPLNVDRTQIVGREDHVSLRAANDALVIDYAHVFNGAYDHSGDVNYEGQTLVLTPRHTHDASLALHQGRWLARTSGRWVSLRYIRRQNTPEKSLAPYRVIDARLQYRLRLHEPSISLALELDNLTDEYYELLERYPSPGRTWSIVASFTF